jgi:hypothetical protein
MREFIKKYKELIRLFASISIAIKLFIICKILQITEIGYKIILTIVLFSIFHALAFIFMKYFYTGIYNYFNNFFIKDNMTAPLDRFSIYQKSLIVMGMIFLTLFSFILIFASI